MTNESQIEFWNGPAGEKWVSQSQHLDSMLAPFAERVLDMAGVQRGQSVIDIGCGAGTLTLASAQAAGHDGHVLGVDVSEPLISLAKRRAQDIGSSAQFELADASAYMFETKANLMLSRFGVMFFEDPVAAFTHLRTGLVPGGRLAFVCWQALPLNDWAFAPLQTARPFFKAPPMPADPTAPGPFAFSDKDRLGGILTDSGWKSVEIVPFETPIVIPGEDLQSNVEFMLQMGPVSRIMADQALDKAPIEAALAAFLEKSRSGEGKVTLNSACWSVSARA